MGLMAVLLVGCGPDLAGIEEWDAYLERLTEASVPATIDCGAETIEIGETRQCRALSERGTVIEVEGYAPLIWSSLNPVRMSITVTGIVTALSEGEVTIQVEGPRRSSASATYVVEAPPVDG